MITNYDIEKNLYRSLKAEFVRPSTPLVGHTYIGGMVYNGDRPLNSQDEDITVKTIATSGDGFPQYSTVNINIYVPDLAENHGGFVRNGKRLAELSKAVVDLVETFNYPNTATFVESQTEIPLDAVKQHYMNIRVRVDIYAEINQ